MTQNLPSDIYLLIRERCSFRKKLSIWNIDLRETRLKAGFIS